MPIPNSELGGFRSWAGPLGHPGLIPRGHNYQICRQDLIMTGLSTWGGVRKPCRAATTPDSLGLCCCVCHGNQMQEVFEAGMKLFKAKLSFIVLLLLPTFWWFYCPSTYSQDGPCSLHQVAGRKFCGDTRGAGMGAPCLPRSSPVPRRTQAVEGTVGAPGRPSQREVVRTFPLGPSCQGARRAQGKGSSSFNL